MSKGCIRGLLFANLTRPLTQFGLRVVPGCSQLRQIECITRQNETCNRLRDLHPCRGTHQLDEEITSEALNKWHAFTSLYIFLHLRQDATLGSYNVIEHLKSRPRLRFATESKLPRIPWGQLTEKKFFLQLEQSKRIYSRTAHADATSSSRRLRLSDTPRRAFPWPSQRAAASGRTEQRSYRPLHGPHGTYSRAHR
jgi:hypothetical protein